MNWTRSLRCAATLAIVLAAASTASAAGSANLSMTQSETHEVCFYNEASDTYSGGVVGGLANEIRFLGLAGKTEEAVSGINMYLLGGASRNGSVFSATLPCAAGKGCESVVVFMNRNKTWCGYIVDGKDITEEFCGTWDFGKCPTDDTSTLQWFER